MRKPESFKICGMRRVPKDKEKMDIIVDLEYNIETMYKMWRKEGFKNL